MKRYEAYKSCNIPWIKQIPEHWGAQRGKNLYRKEQRAVRDTDEVVTCFRDGRVTLRKNRRTTGFTEALNEIGYQGIRKGDLVIHVMDAFAGAIGVSDSDGKGTPVYNVCTPKGDSNNYYYAYALREMARAGFIQSLYRGIRERSSDFRFDVFARQYLPVPPRDEQDQIVRYLDWQVSKINRLIAAKRKKIILLKEWKQRRITEVVTHGITPNVPHRDSGIAWIGAIPAHWHCVALKRCAMVKSGITLGKQYPVGTQLVSVPYLRVANVQDGFVSIETVTNLNVTPEEATQYALPKGCVLMTEGGDRDKLGRGCVWNSEIENCIHQNHIFAVTVNDKLLFNKWLEYVSACDIGRVYFDITAIKTTNLACTNATKVMTFPIPLPPRDEQERITNELNRITCKFNDARINLEKQIERLQELRTRLISDAVTGQIDVRGIEVPDYEHYDEAPENATEESSDSDYDTEE